jgi:nucleoside-diphosphate-sugar epimerase
LLLSGRQPLAIKSSANEESILNPISLYAETKINSENYILEKLDKSVGIILRFATVYGLSPRMRFDLTINDFTRELVMENELVIYGENFYRPYCHILDLTDGIILFINKKSEFQIFNVGNSSENYNKKEIAEKLFDFFPEGSIKYIKRDNDPRDYKVNFDRIKKIGFCPKKTIIHGIEEVIKSKELFKNIYDKNYINLC